MQGGIEFILESENFKDLYKSIKLYQYLKGDLSLLEFLEAQLRRHMGDEEISEIEEEVESLFNKLHFDIKEAPDEPSLAKSQYSFDTAEIKNVVKKAIKEKRDIEIEYYNASNENFKKYHIRPDQVSGSMLDAFCYKKGKNKVFRLNRIKDIKML